MQDTQNNWQVKAQGKIYEADFEELKQWINEGAVLLSDQVKRGNLRWLSIEQVPELAEIVNSNDLIAANGVASAEEIIETQPAFENAAREIDSETIVEKICLSHVDAAVAFTCDICKNFFCKVCPNSFSGTIKLCPLCGSLCRSVNEPAKTHGTIGAINKPYSKTETVAGGFEKQNRNKLQNSNFAKAFIHTPKQLHRLIEKKLALISLRLRHSRRGKNT